MRIPVPLAWGLVLLGFATAGLLRQFNDGTPTSPHVSPLVGSLLFAAIVFLLLVSAREWRRGPVAGRGVRLGSITPLLLMLLIEKWVSIALYPLLFEAGDPGSSPQLADARFRAFAGVSLIVVCFVLGALSRPASRRTWRRAHPARWPAAAGATLLVVGSCYLLLSALSAAFGAQFTLVWPPASGLLAWVLIGQALLAFGEELYYRGLLLSEIERLTPRLGVAGVSVRRWTALGFTAALFGAEHFVLGPPWDASLRQAVFTVALGLLLGILVMVSNNLHFSAGVHAWVNWLLLGAAPHFVADDGRPALPPGTYIGLTLIIAFVLAFLLHGRKRRRESRNSGDLMPAL